MCRNRVQPPAPSKLAASYRSEGMFFRPLYRITRLNGMPIQMFAIRTETSDHDGEVSQSTCRPPMPWITEFTTPDSLFSIQAQVDEDTISGSSQGTRNNARS